MTTSLRKLGGGRKPTSKPSGAKIPIPNAESLETSRPVVTDLMEQRAKLAALTENWDRQNLFVAFPCYKTTNPLTAWTLLAISQDLGVGKVHFDMELGDAMIYHARNKLAARFLAHGAEWMLTIDDDMVPPIGRPAFLKPYCRIPDGYPDELAGLHVVHQLMGHGHKIIGGSYYARRPNGPMVNSLGVNGAVSANQSPLSGNRFDHYGAPVAVDWVGTGCMLIHRDVFLAIQEKFPELAPAEGQEILGWNFFQPASATEGEDVSFCRRATAAGHQVYLDPKLLCMHVGYKAYGHEAVA